MEIKIIKHQKARQVRQFAKEAASIHVRTFTGFFLTFLGEGFLTRLYEGFAKHSDSCLILAVEEEKVVGFLACSENLSDFYKYLIKTSLIPFAYYSVIAFFKKPSALFRLLRALTYPSETKTEEKIFEISSIGVLPEAKNKGVGSILLRTVQETVNFDKFSCIQLETDRDNNDAVNNFYKKNGFVLHETYETPEGRRMNRLRYTLN
ncbi:MAG: GNAT family N-acetyltransferase [Oscillospiraceae bacterium]|jgi:ribosomal protein S18 acetylase RimI-like enzyme|nr:GNAT family N-acetyltransferase [Oscillospiraceae bacterium]